MKFQDVENNHIHKSIVLRKEKLCLRKKGKTQALWKQYPNVLMLRKLDTS